MTQPTDESETSRFRSAFYADHERDMADPVYRAAYEAASRRVTVEEDGVIYGDYPVPDDAATWSPPSPRFGDSPSRTR